MDCSTFSNKTAADDTTLSEENNGVLRKQLDAAMRNYETVQQELYEAKRNYQTALDVQQHLTVEIDTQRDKEQRRETELLSKVAALQDEVAALRAERMTAADFHAQQIESLENKIRNLKEQLDLKKIEENVHQDKTMNRSSDELIALKNEHNDLLSCMKDQKIQLDEKETIIGTLKEHLTELEEKVTWSSEALNRKKDEFESVIEALHSAQSDLAMANGELQRVKNEGSNHAAKGNSLFAEVEDKRQEMAKTLIQMKQNNAQLKREIVNKQAEIDSLLCEKRTLWDEMTGLSSFLDAEMIRSYENHITTLQRTLSSQRRESSRWLSKMHESSNSHIAEYVSGVLAHLQNRCSELTDEILELNIDNLNKAKQICEVHKKMAALRLKGQDLTEKESVENSDKEKKIIEIEIKSEIKQEIKMELQNNTVERLHDKENIKPLTKKEKTVNDVKKKVTF